MNNHMLNESYYSEGGSCGDMPTIFLIRHGVSTSNAGFATSDPKRIILTERGVVQAREIAHFLRSTVSLDLIITSPYLRARRTADQTKLLFPSVPLERWDVQEFSYLSSMHREISTTEDRRPLVNMYWEICDPSFVDGPWSESFEGFIGRVRKFLTQLKNIEHECIAVFSHEQFIRAALLLMEHDPVEVTEQMMSDFRASLIKDPFPNGAIEQVKFHRDYEDWSHERMTVDPRLLEQKVALPVGH